jgi:DNA-binding response OmpR family regulator
MAKILVVDDSKTVNKYVESVLTPTGHSLAFALDGEEAESKIKFEPFDLIILDVVMPKKNGFQLCRELKCSEQYRNIPVIMLTTKSMDADRFWGMRQGANEYLTKPFKPEDLLGAINKYVGQKPDKGATESAQGSTTFNRTLKKFFSRFRN